MHCRCNGVPSLDEAISDPFSGLLTSGKLKCYTVASNSMSACFVSPGLLLKGLDVLVQVWPHACVDEGAL